MKREFANFELETKLELPVTKDNYFKYDVIVTKNGNFVNIITNKELSLPIAEMLLTGDEKNC